MMLFASGRPVLDKVAVNLTGSGSRILWRSFSSSFNDEVRWLSSGSPTGRLWIDHCPIRSHMAARGSLAFDLYVLLTADRAESSRRRRRRTQRELVVVWTPWTVVPR